jgi:hypothetical protein
MHVGASERLGIPPVAEWAESIETFAGDLAEVEPAGSDAPTGVLVVRLFNWKPADDAASAERFYVDVYAPHVRRLPGVRRYLQGQVVSLRSRAPRLARLTVLECAGWDAMRSAVNPALLPRVSRLEEWADNIETYVTEYQEIPRE